MTTRSPAWLMRACSGNHARHITTSALALQSQHRNACGIMPDTERCTGSYRARKESICRRRLYLHHHRPPVCLLAVGYICGAAPPYKFIFAIAMLTSLSASDSWPHIIQQPACMRAAFSLSLFCNYEGCLFADI